jgi:hypothetical protein
LPFVFLSKAKLLSHLGKGEKKEKRREEKRREED